MQLTIIN